MTIRQVTVLLSFFTVAFVIVSCSNDKYFERNVKIADGSWATNNKIPFSVVIQDTTTFYDFYVNLRNDVTYPYCNLILFMQTTFPDGKIARDTIECLLADFQGKWLGSGMGSVRYNRFLFQQGVKFKKPGMYCFEFEQAMRIDPLTGIRDIGIRIDKKQGTTR
ncbi:MAG TPA: gliding motility lipoprotein GldH [Bacteroidales bacterium]|nr:gliding motility lipoprotein GldH [Bacteroidales bacterium]HPS73143.1 gliding motility lipoprotein GldH [Bacteroidales bacterium]